MASRGVLNRRHRAWNQSRSLRRQCQGKRAWPSRKVAEAIARQVGQVAYRCEACGRHHTGHARDAYRERQHEAAMAPIMTVTAGEGGDWTAQRLLQVVQVFAHHYGREPIRLRSLEGRLALW